MWAQTVHSNRVDSQIQKAWRLLPTKLEQRREFVDLLFCKKSTFRVKQMIVHQRITIIRGFPDLPHWSIANYISCQLFRNIPVISHLIGCTTIARHLVYWTLKSLRRRGIRTAEVPFSMIPRARGSVYFGYVFQSNTYFESFNFVGAQIGLRFWAIKSTWSNRIDTNYHWTVFDCYLTWHIGTGFLPLVGHRCSSWPISRKWNLHQTKSRKLSL